MEPNTLITALLNTLAEQLRPMVQDMVRQELATQAPAAAVDLEELARKIDLEELAGNINAADLAGELTSLQLSDIAGDIALEDLAGEFDPDRIGQNIDFDELIRDFFQNNTFSIRP